MKKIEVFLQSIIVDENGDVKDESGGSNHLLLIPHFTKREHKPLHKSFSLKDKEEFYFDFQQISQRTAGSF